MAEKIEGNVENSDEIKDELKDGGNPEKSKDSKLPKTQEEYDAQIQARLDRQEKKHKADLARYQADLDELEELRGKETKRKEMLKVQLETVLKDFPASFAKKFKDDDPETTLAWLNDPETIKDFKISKKDIKEVPDASGKKSVGRKPHGSV